MAEKRKRSARAGKLNFMVVRGTGRVRRFKISPRLFVFAFAFFLVYLLISLVAVNRYLDLRIRLAEKNRQVHRLRIELTSLKNQLYEKQQELRLLTASTRTKPERALAPKAVQVTQISEQGSTPANNGPADEVVELDQQRSEINTEPTQFVDVRDLSVMVTPASLKVAFKVYKISVDPGPLRGYVHIIWVQDPLDPSRAWSYPNVVLTDGMPSDYKTGRVFSIRHFREIKASFERKPDQSVPRVLRIVAYNKTGDIVYSKDYDMAVFVKTGAGSSKGDSRQDSTRKKNLHKPLPQSTKALLSG